MSLPLWKFKIRYEEPDGDVDDDTGRWLMTGDQTVLVLVDADTGEEVDQFKHRQIEDLLGDLESFAFPSVASELAEAGKRILENAANLYREHGTSCPTTQDEEAHCTCGFDRMRAAIARWELEGYQ